MTPSENEEIVRRSIAIFNESGISSPAAISLLHEDIVFEEPPEQPGAQAARGPAAALEVFSRFEEAWEEHRSEIEQIRELEDGRVLALTREHFRGRDGLVVDQPCGMIYTLRDGKIARYQAFWERATALKAAGLA